MFGAVIQGLWARMRLALGGGRVSSGCDVETWSWDALGSGVEHVSQGLLHGDLGPRCSWLWGEAG